MKVGDRVKIDVAKADFIPQQLPILKKMLKNGGDGRLLIRSIEGTFAHVSGWEGDALLGTLRVPLKALKEHKDSSATQFTDRITEGYEMETSYKGFKLIKNGGFLKALNDDGFTKFEIASSGGSGSYSKEDVNKLKQKIDQRID
jgi:hypothetical protein